MRGYASRLRLHLGAYRRDVLGLDEPLERSVKGQIRLYHHILPHERHLDNLIGPAAAHLATYLKSRPDLRLHRDFAHLNSSQAFAFNLFLPFFCSEAQQAGCLLRALGDSGSLSSWDLESVPDAIEGTNLDAIWCAGGRYSLCEVKLSEREFGKARPDPAHEAKLTRLYAPRLTGKVDPALLTLDRFCANYQLLRNFWHALGVQGSRLLLLLPRENEDPWAHAHEFRMLVLPEHRSLIEIFAIEDVLSRLAADAAVSQDMREHVRLLQRKYLVHGQDE